MTAPPVPLSPECDMARDHEPLHRLCSNSKDIPLPNAKPYDPPLTRASCKCECHRESDACSSD